MDKGFKILIASDGRRVRLMRTNLPVEG